MFSLGYIKDKWTHAGFQKYFQNTGWLFVSRILSALVSFLTTIFIARKIGPENFGQLSYALSFVGIFSFLSSLGLDNVLYRDLIKYPEKKKEYLGSALTLRLIAGTLVTTIIVIMAIFFAKDDVSRVLIFILASGCIFNSFQIVNYEFQAQVKSIYPSIISFLVTLILNILKILILVSGKGVIYLAFVLLFESILYAVFYWFAYEKKIEGSIFEWKFNMEISRNLLKDSWPLMFTSAFMLIYSRIDQILIKNMIDAHAVGIYDAAVKVAEVWYFIPGIIVSSLFPAIVNAKKTSEILYYARLKKLFITLIFIAIAIALPVSILAPFIINLIYGSAFMDGVIILQIYVWSCLGTFLSILTNSYLVTENHRAILFFQSFVPMVLNIMLNLLWIPKYGIVGSAYATLISYSLGPLSILCFRKTRSKIFSMIGV
jgi:O-antigen/teichoic acid export membrane protein